MYHLEVYMCSLVSFSLSLSGPVMDLLAFPRTIEEGDDIEVDESESDSEDEVCGLRVLNCTSRYWLLFLTCRL